MIFLFKMQRNVESKTIKVGKTKSGEIMLLSKCAGCDSKKSKFIKEQEARGLLSELKGIKVPILNDLPIANILF